jgi:hypothetical protein
MIKKLYLEDDAHQGPVLKLNRRSSDTGDLYFLHRVSEDILEPLWSRSLRPAKYKMDSTLWSLTGKEYEL